MPRLWRLAAIYILGLAAFVPLAWLASFSDYFSWDLHTARLIQSVHMPGLFEFMAAISFLGDEWTPHALTVSTAIVFLAFRRRRAGVGLFLTVVSGELINRTLKYLIGRPRPAPDVVHVFRYYWSKSFPSGHVTFYVCYFGFLFFLAYSLMPRGSLRRRWVLTLTCLPILLIGFSRVYLGEHWPSDTIGSYLLGGMWVSLCVQGYRRWTQRALAA